MMKVHRKVLFTIAGMALLCISACHNPFFPGQEDPQKGIPADPEVPVITVEPQGTTYRVNETAKPLTVTATVKDKGTLSYQWYRNTKDNTEKGTEIPGAIGSSYMPPTAEVGALYYYVVVTNTLNKKTARTCSDTAGIGVGVIAVTITGLTAEDKEYDGTTAATASGIETAEIRGAADGDEVMIGAGTAAFADKNVGTEKAVSFSGWSLGGADAKNYMLQAQPAKVKAAITEKPVTITVKVEDKFFDGTTTAKVSGTPVINGVIKGDEVSVKAGTAAFEDKNVGMEKTVSFSGWSLGGEDAGNYLLAEQPAKVKAYITPAFLTMARITLSPVDSTVAITVNGLYGTDTAAFTLDSPLPVGITISANTINYNGTTAFANPGAVGTLNFLISAGPNYAAVGTTNVEVYDGQVNYDPSIEGTYDRRIPVTRNNIAKFNAYANTTRGLTLHYKLTENILLLTQPESGWSNWTAIGTDANRFTGSFDGQEHTITYLTIDTGANYQGMFGHIGTGGVVRSLGLVEAGVSGGGNVGGVAGYNVGTVQNCYARDSVINSTGVVAAGGVVGYNTGVVRNCYAVGSFTGNGRNSSGDSSVGGVVGYNYNGGTVQNCYTTCDVSVSISGSSRYANVGGVVGYNNGSGSMVNRCYTSGNVDVTFSGSFNPFHIGGVVGFVTTGTVQNCYAAGNVSGNSGSGNTYIGGIAGSRSDSGITQNCYATGKCSISSTNSSIRVGGIMGYSDASTVRNNVALNPSVTKTYNSSSLIGRVVGSSSGTRVNNYARSDMIVQYNTADTPTDKTISAGPTTMDGADVTAEQYNDPIWWTTPATWNTTGTAFAWDFENVWEWSDTRQLPILRGVGGNQ